MAGVVGEGTLQVVETHLYIDYCGYYITVYLSKLSECYTSEGRISLYENFIV